MSTNVMPLAHLHFDIISAKIIHSYLTLLLVFAPQSLLQGVYSSSKSKFSDYSLTFPINRSTFPDLYATHFSMVTGSLSVLVTTVSPENTMAEPIEVPF